MKEFTNTLTKTVELPSLGRVYKEAIDPHITLRGMVTSDEVTRLSVSDRKFEKLCEVIDNCTTSEQHISSYDMCIGDYRFLLFNLRTLTYGPKYHITATCPICGMQSKEVIDISDINVFKYNEENIEKYRTIELPISKYKITLKFLTCRMLDDIDERVAEFKRKANVDNTLIQSIAARIDTIDGSKPDPLFITDWVRKLPMQDINVITQYADKLDTLIGIDSEVFLTCNLCTYSYKANIKTDSEFFRPALDI